MVDPIDDILQEVDSLPEPEEKAEKEDRTSQSDKLVAFARNHVDLFHDSNRDCYALDKKTGEARRLESRAFKDWLSAGFYQENEKAVKTQSLNEALGTLSALARFEGDELKVYLRTAKKDDCYYLDLCEPGQSRAIEWSAKGWRIVSNHGVLFVRGESMQALPEPTRNGNIEPLWQLCNIPKDDRALVLAWLIDSMRPDTPYPGLELLGEQGSGKSTATEALRRLVDPNGCNLRSAPKNTEDIFVCAGMNHVVAYENLSHISAPMQDALCVLSTGGGYAKRKLYSDADESVISVQRPWVVNGISALVTAQDLLDRTICIECPIIRDRTASADQWAQFESKLPIILGGIFDLASASLAVVDSIHLDATDRPRMIEYCLLGMAATQVMSQEPRKFLELFKGNRRESIGRTIEGSPVCTAIIELMNQRAELNAPAGEILKTLEAYRPQGSQESWPRSGKGMGDALRRYAPALRQLDIDCYCTGKVGGYPRWVIKKKLPDQSPASLQVMAKEPKSMTWGLSGLESDKHTAHEPEGWEAEI